MYSNRVKTHTSTFGANFRWPIVGSPTTFHRIADKCSYQKLVIGIPDDAIECRNFEDTMNSSDGCYVCSSNKKYHWITVEIPMLPHYHASTIVRQGSDVGHTSSLLDVSLVVVGIPTTSDDVGLTAWPSMHESIE